MKIHVYVVGLGLVLCACDKDSNDTSKTTKEDAGPEARAAEVFGSGLTAIAPGEGYAGKTLEEWAIEYTKWTYAQTSCDSALTDSDGSLCDLYQEDSDSPVFFFERSGYTYGRGAVENRTSCRVPAGKALLVPVAVVVIDNTDAMEPAEQVPEIAASVMDSMRSMMLKADGSDIGDLSERGMGPFSMEVEIPPAPNYFSCLEVDGIADTIFKPVYVTGYLALIEPPSSGRHQLEYASAFTYLNGAYAFHVKTDFTVDEPTE